MMTIRIHRSDDSNRFNDLQRQLSTTKANAEARTKAKHNYNTRYKYYYAIWTLTMK